MIQNTVGEPPKTNQKVDPFTLKDGRQVVIRSIRPDDAELLVRLFYRLSDRSKRLRFHASVEHLSPEQIQEEAETLAAINPQQDAALIATTKENGAEHIVAVVRFSRANPTDALAEIAMLVRDDFQNQGLGTYLTCKLTNIARSMGIQQFVASIIPENHQVLRVFEKLSLPIKQEKYIGETQVFVSLKKSAGESSI